MKHTLLFLVLALIVFVSCSKEKEEQEVRYEFLADNPDSYRLEYSTDHADGTSIETVTATTWSKTVTIEKITEGWGVPTVVGVTVFPPASWNGPAKSAHVTLKIFIDGEEKATENGTLDWNKTQGIKAFTIL